jgi:hypothetical protein
MNAREMNTKLISAFPELKRAYEECTSWQEGDETGSHIVFGDVLVTLMLEYIKSENYQLVKKYIAFLESLLQSDDEYATDVIATSVIEGIIFDDIDQAEVKKLLGEKCLEIWRGYEK